MGSGASSHRTARSPSTLTVDVGEPQTFSKRLCVLVQDPVRRGLTATQFQEFFETHCGTVDWSLAHGTNANVWCHPTKLARLCMQSNLGPKITECPDEPNLYAVKKLFIMPHTCTAKGCVSYAEKVNPSGKEVQFYISHYWGEDFAEFVQSTLKHAWSVDAKFWRMVAYWCCAFAINQHFVEVALGSSLKTSPFHRVLSSPCCRGTVMNINQCASALFRIWCVYEVFLTHSLEKSFTINTKHGPLAEELSHQLGRSGTINEENLIVVHMNAMLQDFDVNKAQYSVPHDRDMIINAIQTDAAGTESLNTTVKALLAGKAIFTLARHGDIEALTLALKHGAEANKPDQSIVFPLTYARAGNHLDCVQKLMDKEADPYAGECADAVVALADRNGVIRDGALKRLRNLRDKKHAAFKFYSDAGFFEYWTAKHREWAACQDDYVFCYTPTEHTTDWATDAIKRIGYSLDMKTLHAVLNTLIDEQQIVSPARGTGKTLMVVVTDLDPGSVMAIASIWQLNSYLLKGWPLIVVPAGFEGVFADQILANKLLVATLALGIASYHILCPENAVSHTSSFQKICANAHEGTLGDICRRLADFDGEHIDFYVMGGGRGIIHRIVSELKAQYLKVIGEWPAKPTWRVKMYSGSKNVRDTTNGDFQALQEIMTHSDTPLLDIAKFKFFGARDCHACTQNFAAFTVEHFASMLNLWAPCLTAALKLLNDNFNAGLIYPGIKLFKCKVSLREKLSEEDELRFKKIEMIYDSTKPDKVQRYAHKIYMDDSLYGHVAEFKKSTLRALALGGDDSPLCDQILFLYEWSERFRKELIADNDPGMWDIDYVKGFTSIKAEVMDPKPSHGQISAKQPALLNPLDELGLDLLRQALSKFFLRHLSSIYACGFVGEHGSLAVG